ncbi:OmpP1/FadL family transporter [Thermomonas hydrothermalis]|uniref:Long-chain fatty acid transport protein n=1 Tax=Thermomonas hydrothermalis TaxID=213588 RepID=A0A1M4SIS1_9GAMM|nr:outer membrane protein transport protein [Thermomonas hydrothermalis]SHE32133.1 long-chain fatty acid transport protein [Thermomonas hydrothermalis]
MGNNRTIRASALALAVLGTLFVGQAAASGFQLREQSVKNLGKSNAGSLVGKDASVVSLNPAAMVNLDKNTFQADMTVINLNAKFTGGGTILNNPGAPLTGGNGGDPGDPTPVPNMSAVFPMQGALEKLYLGVSLGAPFGLATKYDQGWVGRYRAIESDVKTMDLTLSAALKLSDGVSIGAGFIWERAEATLTKAIDFGTAICAGSGNPANCFNPAYPFQPQALDGGFKVKGADNSIGYVVGAQLAPTDRLAIGVSYRSEIKHELKGSLYFTGVPALLGSDPRFVDGPGGARLVTPSVTTVSVKYAVADNFRVLADYQYTGWDSLQDVTIKRSNGTIVGSEPFHWSNTHFYSLGAEYDLSPALTLRGGIGKDKTPTHDTYRTPRLPDNNRTLLSLGATWNFSDALSFDAAYQRIDIDSPSINLPVDAAAGNTSTLAGWYSGHADLIGVSMQYRF